MIIRRRYSGLNVAAIPEQMQKIRKFSPKVAKTIDQAYHKSKVDGYVKWMDALRNFGG